MLCYSGSEVMFLLNRLLCYNKLQNSVILKQCYIYNICFIVMHVLSRDLLEDKMIWIRTTTLNNIVFPCCGKFGTRAVSNYGWILNVTNFSFNTKIIIFNLLEILISHFWIVTALLYLLISRKFYTLRNIWYQRIFTVLFAMRLYYFKQCRSWNVYFRSSLRLFSSATKKTHFNIGKNSFVLKYALLNECLMAYIIHYAIKKHSRCNENQIENFESCSMQWFVATG